MSDDYDDILELPPRVSRYDPVEELKKDLLGEGQGGVDKAAAIRRLMRMSPEVIARARDDTRRGVKVRTGNPRGRPRKDRPDNEALWAECQAERAKVQRAMSASEAARIVGRRHKLSAAHIMKLTRPYRTP